MGTVKYSGPVASFHCPTNAEIRSLKVHFSPKQEGSGDPSPENVREIMGWDGVVVHNSQDYVSLPEEYQRVEWIKSTGSQYIDTNVLFNHGIKISARMGFAAKENSKTLFGVRIDTGATRFLATYYQGFDFAYWNDTMPFEPEIDHIYDVTFDTSVSSKFTYGAGGRLLTTNVTEIFPNLTGYIFAYHRGSDDSVQGMSKSYFQSMFIENASGTMLFNGYACYRKSDNVAGIYDTVTQTFFTNQGTGEFVCGPDVGQTTDYEFGVLGKNKFDKSTEIVNAQYISGTGEYEEKSTRIMTDYIPIVPHVNYTISIDSQNIENFVLINYNLFDENKNWLGDRLVNGETTSFNGEKTHTFNATFNNAHYVRIVIRDATNTNKNISNKTLENAELQLELGSSPTTYEPYNPNHTVYGGWVDLITGEVREEWSYMKFRWGDVSVNVDLDNYDGKRVTLPGLIISTTIKNNKFCNIAPFNQSYNSDSLHFYTYVSLDVSYARVYLPKNSDDNTMVELAVLLDVPMTYSLAPTQLQTFLGQNNVWSNADYVEVEYDLHETQTLLQRKAFIMANQPHIESASGAIASFNTDLRAPLRECKAYFSPKQDLHGYSNPWPAGGGKNLFDASQIGTSTSAAFITLQLVADTTYTFSSNKPSGAGAFNIQTTNTNLEATGAVYDSHPITFTAIDDAEISIRYYNGSNTSLSDYWYQLEKGSTATAYAPYENICPIEGWTGLNTFKSGKNMAHVYGYSASTISSPTSTRYTTNSYGTTLSTTSPEASVTITQSQWPESTKASYKNGYIAIGVDNMIFGAYYDVSFKVSNITNNPLNASLSNLRLTNPNGSSYMPDTIENDLIIFKNRCFAQRTTSNLQEKDWQIRICGMSFTLSEFMVTPANTSDGVYESYSGTIIPVDWTSEAGTIYGGYVDLVTGELWKTHDIYDLGSLTWGYNSNNTCFFASFTNFANITRIEPRIAACSHYKYEYVARVNIMNDKTINDSQQLNLRQLQIHDNNYDDSTLADFQSAMTGIKIIYLLSTPTLITTLTPTQLKTLRGTNNIWSSANGNIDLKFYKH